MRVVGWVPVPKASPGSRRITRVAAAGGSCQLGTIQKSGVIGTGANCDCVKRTQSWSATDCTDCSCTPCAQAWASNKVAASVAATSLSNRAVNTERCQPSRGAGIPGSPNSACSAPVPASASSTDTDSASNSSISTSETDSTTLSGTSNSSSTMVTQQSEA